MSEQISQPLTQREFWNGRVGEEWAAQADRIDAMAQPMTGPALAALDVQPGERVLDIGCGGGATTFALARTAGESGRVVGADLSRPLLELARRRAQAQGAIVDFIEADVSTAAIPGAPFDAAFSRFGVMFFDEPTQAFAHLRGALRKGGRLVFVCWRTAAENVWATAPLEAIAPILKAPLPPPNPDAPGPFAFADRAKIEKILSDSGWTSVAVEAWDGQVALGGGGSAEEAAAFLLRIGPCARAVADQDLDHADVLRRIVARLRAHESPTGVRMPAACWIVGARA